ncbi:MAG: LamG-like jellyroll fold domain-containing protein [Pirellulaceae bacterium]
MRHAVWLIVAVFSSQVCCRTSIGFELQVGAAIVDVTPNQLPVLVNGGMTSRSVDQVKTHVNARALVLDDGQERIGIVVVDSCMVPKHLADEAKQLIETRTSLRADRILISATHTHTAPSSMGALGTDADPNYVPFLRQKLAEAMVAAEANLRPAQVGWGSAMAPEFTALRRWVRRPDRVALDPFGNPTVRANMHAASNPDDAIGPSGPEDPQLSMIAFQTLDGKPLAVLSNFSMHYFGDSAISADYFGLFCDGLQAHLSESEAGSGGDLQPVAIMSHGCSGDIWRRDYMQRRAVAEGTIDEYAQGLLGVATKVYDSIEYQSDATLSMLETRLKLRYRTPDAQRLEWAQRIVQELDGELPKTQPEIYAREQVFLHEMQETEVVLQAIRIGDIAIATTPNETYALTGLKLKRQSPLERTMIIELANGGDGYIPPPEQHVLGGYNTWAARSAGLEETAEPKIVAADLRLLEQVCRRPRRSLTQSRGPATQALLAAKPLHYWRLDEMSGPAAVDCANGQSNAFYEAGVIFFLEGPESLTPRNKDRFTQADEVNRCAHFAGGRLAAQLTQLDQDYHVSLSVWNGMPIDARPVTGWFFSRDQPYSLTDSGVHVGLSGSDGGLPGRIIVQVGSEPVRIGTTAIERWSWHRVAIVKSSDRLSVYLDGGTEPEVSVMLPDTVATPSHHFYFGGRSDNDSNWQGCLDEIAVFDHAAR